MLIFLFFIKILNFKSKYSLYLLYNYSIYKKKINLKKILIFFNFNNFLYNFNFIKLNLYFLLKSHRYRVNKNFKILKDKLDYMLDGYINMSGRRWRIYSNILFKNIFKIIYFKKRLFLIKKTFKLKSRYFFKK